MDNLTHSLTGFALARVGLDRLSPRATLLLLLSANAPDLDIASLALGPLKYFEAHRGYSHSVLLLPVMALLATLVTAAVFRERLPWMRAWSLGCVGVASHLLIDWTNNYGIRFLLPFSSRWFHLDWTSLYDGWIMLALAFGALWPVFSRVVSREIGERPKAMRGPAMFALLFFVLFDCGRALLHDRAIAELDSRLYEDMPPVRTAVLPNPFNPLHWGGVVETERAYVTVPVNVFGDLEPGQIRSYFKPPESSALENAEQRPEFRYFRYFARFPVWSIVPISQDGDRQRFELTDLRFGRPGAGSFHCIAVEDSRGTLTASWFTYGDGRELGWTVATGQKTSP